MTSVLTSAHCPCDPRPHRPIRTDDQLVGRRAATWVRWGQRLGSLHGFVGGPSCVGLATRGGGTPLHSGQRRQHLGSPLKRHPDRQPAQMLLILGTQAAGQQPQLLIQGGKARFHRPGRCHSCAGGPGRVLPRFAGDDGASPAPAAPPYTADSAGVRLRAGCSTASWRCPTPGPGSAEPLGDSSVR
jgi:hypothetical protein